MKHFALDKITVDVDLRRGTLPFEFGRQTRSAPIRERVGFEITDVGYGLIFIDGSKSGEREMPPSVIMSCPVKRRLPALLIHGGPAERKPEFGPHVAVIFNESDVIAVGDRTRRQRKFRDERAMTRAFVIVRKSAAIVTDLDDGFVEIDEMVGTDRRAVRLRRARRSRPTIEYWMERVLGEDMVDVGYEQLLMLLLVINSENQNRLDLIAKLLVRSGKKVIDVGVDSGTVAVRFVNSRPRDQPPQVASMHVAS